ncbi:uncharacterized protein LOC134419126 [Melospiza melodia melodia]|uniref:uncharacterized protein LOC134419126 n=1 Tax=Melospiza melodia melodia TaxID=1914991 RepID=UPI002FD17A2C
MGIQKVKVKVLILKLLRLQQVCYFKVQFIILPRRMAREGTERWHSRLSPGHPGPARARVPRSAPCSAERGLGARSGANALGSAAAPGGGGRCPQGRKNHQTPPIFAKSFGVWAAKGKRPQHQGSAGGLWSCPRCGAVLAGAPWSLPSPGTQREPCPKWLWHLGRNVAAVPEQLEEKTSQQRQIATEARVVFGAGSAESCICLCCHSLSTAWEQPGNGTGAISDAPVRRTQTQPFSLTGPSTQSSAHILRAKSSIQREKTQKKKHQQGRDKRIPVG